MASVMPDPRLPSQQQSIALTLASPKLYGLMTEGRVGLVL